MQTAERPAKWPPSRATGPGRSHACPRLAGPALVSARCRPSACGTRGTERRASAAGRTRSRTLSGTLPGRVPLPHNAQCGSFPGVPPTPLCARGDILCSQNHPGLSERRLTLPRVRTPRTAGREHGRARPGLHGLLCPQCTCDQDLSGDRNYHLVDVGQTGEDSGLFGTRSAGRAACGAAGQPRGPAMPRRPSGPRDGAQSSSAEARSTCSDPRGRPAQPLGRPDGRLLKSSAKLEALPQDSFVKRTRR